MLFVGLQTIKHIFFLIFFRFFQAFDLNSSFEFILFSLSFLKCEIRTTPVLKVESLWHFCRLLSMVPIIVSRISIRGGELWGWPIYEFINTERSSYTTFLTFLHETLNIEGHPHLFPFTVSKVEFETHLGPICCLSNGSMKAPKIPEREMP